jgi:four helix bundle protein
MQVSNTPARKFTDLEVWQVAHSLVLEVYKVSDSFPKSEIYGLTSQFRRAAISVPANIAEGFSKRGKNDKLRFYNIAQGSLEECRYFIILAQDLGFGDMSNLMSKLDKVANLLGAYISKIQSSSF